MRLEQASTAELRHLLVQEYGVRAHPAASRQHLIDLLLLSNNRTARNPVDDKREILMKYISDNSGRLALPCNGNCNQHMDATVLCCYMSLVEEDTGGSTED